MAESNRTIETDTQAQQVASADGSRDREVTPHLEVMSGVEAVETLAKLKLVSQQRVLLARLLISLVVLPLPIFTLIVAAVQPQFEQNLYKHSATAAFFTFLILVGLFAYHAFMFWYNPFVLEDRDLIRRKEQVINALSLTLSIPGVGGLLFTVITGTSASTGLSLLEQLGQRFPLQGWGGALLLGVLVAWLVWLFYNYMPLAQRLARSARGREGGPIARLRAWLGEQWQRLVSIWIQWRVRIILLVSSFLSIGLLMSFLVNYLRAGVGLDWAVGAVLIALFLMQVAGALAVRLGSPTALIWSNGATFTLLFAVESLTRHGALAGDRVLSHWVAWGVIIEVLAVFTLLVRRMRQLSPNGARMQAFKQAL